jgi:hypothetical protein
MSDPPGWLAPPPPSAPPPPPPPSVPPAPPPEAEPAPQLWGVKPAQVHDYPWVKLVVAVLLIVAVGWALSSLLFPGLRTPPAFPTPTPTPAGVEYARASTFWNDGEQPALVEVVRGLPAISTNCKGNLTAACRNAITAMDVKLKYAVSVINTGDIPACLTTHVGRYKGDLLSMDGGMQISLIGFNAGDRDKVAQGLEQFREALLPLADDATSVSNDVKVLCN